MERTGNGFQSGAATDPHQAESNGIETFVRHLKQGLIWPGQGAGRINASPTGELSR